MIKDQGAITTTKEEGEEGKKINYKKEGNCSRAVAFFYSLNLSVC